MRTSIPNWVLATSMAVAAVAGPTAAQAALVGRDLNGSPGSFEAYYDTVLNITWLANADLAKTSSFGVSGIGADGLMTWGSANAWIAAMNAANYLGINRWRLPTLSPVNGVSFNASASTNGSTDQSFNFAGSQSEMAYNYYSNLRGQAQFNSSGGFNSSWGVFTGASALPFANINANNKNLSNSYWTGLATSPANLGAWTFSYASGGQGTLANVSQNTGFAWAVVSGDVSAVPLPNVFLVMLSGLGFLGMVGHRRQA